MRDESVWPETTDGGLLKQLFGHYPTMHDAAILAVDINRANESVTMVVDYRDSVDDDEAKPFSVRIKILWTGVDRFELPIGDEDLLSISFERDADMIVTYLETWPGEFGMVVSESVDATLMQVDPGDFDGRSKIRYL